MSRSLNISTDLSLPLDAATSAQAIIAIRGAGKSYTAAVVAEEMIAAGVQTVIVDPTGVWWGLRSSADGKKAGLPVIVMGGNHGDVPLEETAGEVVAEFVVDSGASVILDLSLMRKNAQKRFMADFAEHLYHLKGQSKNQTTLHGILDEADRFAPQKPQPEHARLLGAIEDWVRLGRSRGFGITMITQRAAVLNKDVLTQVETLIVLRTTSPQDRKAIMEWVQENATEEEFKTVSSSLSSLPNGTAWVWSPQLLQVLKKVKIRTRDTFNSSATPKVGEKRIEPKVAAPVDLKALQGRIAATIEKAKANDPKALKAKVVELERKLMMLPTSKEKVVEKTVHVIPQSSIDALKDVMKRATEEATLLHRIASDLAILVGKASDFDDRQANKPPFMPSGAPWKRTKIEVPKFAPRVPKETGGLKAGARLILRILAARSPGSMSRNQIATLSGIKPGGSTFVTYIGQLRRLGLIEQDGDEYSANMAGIDCVGPQDAPPTGRENVLRMWGPKLKAGARAILETVVNEGPVARGDLGSKLGINPDGSTFVTYVGILRRNGLIVVDGDTICANEEVFA